MKASGFSFCLFHFPFTLNMLWEIMPPTTASSTPEGTQQSLDISANINTVSPVSSRWSFPPTKFTVRLLCSHVMARLRCEFTEVCPLRCIILGPHLFPLWSDSGTCSKAPFIQTTTRVRSLPTTRLRHATWEGRGEGDGTSCNTTKTKPAGRPRAKHTSCKETGFSNPANPLRRDSRKDQTLLCEG